MRSFCGVLAAHPGLHFYNVLLPRDRFSSGLSHVDRLSVAGLTALAYGYLEAEHVGVLMIALGDHSDGLTEWM
jgi:hypothetical protein